MMVRKAEPADAGFLAKIEELSIAHPWSIALFKADLENNPNALYFVAEDNTEILGFIGVHDIVGEINITNIAVDPKHRRKGIGEKLINALLLEIENKKVKGEDIIGITLEVRISNTPAIQLYEKYGFVSEGTRKNYYSDGEDASIMWLRY